MHIKSPSAQKMLNSGAGYAQAGFMTKHDRQSHFKEEHRMRAFIVRGIPESLRKDAWWLAEYPSTSSERQLRNIQTTSRILRQVDRSISRPRTGPLEPRLPSA
jgi:hypothetical protein